MYFLDLSPETKTKMNVFKLKYLEQILKTFLKLDGIWYKNISSPGIGKKSLILRENFLLNKNQSYHLKVEIESVNF